VWPGKLLTDSYFFIFFIYFNKTYIKILCYNNRAHTSLNQSSDNRSSLSGFAGLVQYLDHHLTILVELLTTLLFIVKLTNTLALLIVEPKCTLAASHAALGESR